MPQGIHEPPMLNLLIEQSNESVSSLIRHRVPINAHGAIVAKTRLSYEGQSKYWGRGRDVRLRR